MNEQLRDKSEPMVMTEQTVIVRLFIKHKSGNVPPLLYVAGFAVHDCA
jgi:hypothetical protein